MVPFIPALWGLYSAEDAPDGRGFLVFKKGAESNETSHPLPFCILKNAMKDFMLAHEYCCALSYAGYLVTSLPSRNPSMQQILFG